MTEPATEDTEELPPPTPADGSAMTFAEVAAAFGLPADAKAVVLTPTSALAIAADYPEPHTAPEPEEATDGE